MADNLLEKIESIENLSIEELGFEQKIVGFGFVDPNELIAHPLNFRVHPANQRVAFIGSLNEVGWIAPVLVNKNSGRIIDGHLRVEEAIARKFKRVPIMLLDLTNDEEKKALLLLDPIAQLATENSERISAILDSVIFGQAQLARHIKEIASRNGVAFKRSMIGEKEDGVERDHKENENPDKEISVRINQIWQLGNHKLLCGDCTNRRLVDILFKDKKPTLIFADPPYGIDLIKDNKGVVGGGSKQYPTKIFAKIEGDNAEYDPRFLLQTFPDIKYAFWGGNYFANLLPTSRCWLIWDKCHIAERTFASCELCWTNFEGHSKIYKVTWDGYTKEGENGSKVHPSQKAVKLYADIFSDFTTPDDLIYDPYLGSGTSILAAIQAGRICYGAELSVEYCEIIINRWQEFTDEKAELIYEDSDVTRN